MLEEDGRHGVTGWVSSWLGGRGAQSVPNTPQRPTSSQSLNSVRSNTHKDTLTVSVSVKKEKPKWKYMCIICLPEAVNVQICPLS